MLNKQEDLNHVGKRTVSSVTLYMIQMPFLPKPSVKYLKFKMGYLTVIPRS